MEHYRVTIDDKPVGTYRIFKNGSFFVDTRFYKKHTADEFVENAKKDGLDAKATLYRKVKWNNTYVYDQIGE